MGVFSWRDVPRTALAYKDGKPYVEVKGVRGVERQTVTLGDESKDRIQVIEGLQGGEELVAQTEK